MSSFLTPGTSACTHGMQRRLRSRLSLSVERPRLPGQKGALEKALEPLVNIEKWIKAGDISIR